MLVDTLWSIPLRQMPMIRHGTAWYGMMAGTHGCLLHYIVYFVWFLYLSICNGNTTCFFHATAGIHLRFPTASPLRDRILGEEVTISVWDQDEHGEWWRVIFYEGGWKEWTSLSYLESVFDENRQLTWYGKAFVHRHFQ